MNRLSLEVVSWEELDGDALEAATYASLRIRLDDVFLTEVHDKAVRTTRELVRVSAYPLAMWFAANWWRLRWEGSRRGADWQMSHRIGGAGGGYVWPDIVLESDGEQIRIEARLHSGAEWEPIAYLTDKRAFLSAGEFEAAVASFIETVIARLTECGHTTNPLADLWTTLQGERRDEKCAQTRRLEALLGFDAEEAPTVLLDGYAGGVDEFGIEAVAELAAAATNGAAPDWGSISASLSTGQEMTIPHWSTLRNLATQAVEGLTGPWRHGPWRRGEVAARAVRDQLGVPRGPISNEDFKDWFSLDPAHPAAGTPSIAAFGLRQEDCSRLKICRRSAHPTGCRFELARLLADNLLGAAAGDSLLPVTHGKTARQRLQRAFAAEFLVPEEDLKERLGYDPQDDAIEDTAREFDVSPRLVSTRLVNKHMLPPDALMEDWD